MRYAETGFNLEIDLTRGNIERVATDPELTERDRGERKRMPIEEFILHGGF